MPRSYPTFALSVGRFPGHAAQATVINLSVPSAVLSGYHSCQSVSLCPGMNMDHPIFEHYAFTEPADEPGFRRNGLGVRERFEFVNADVYPDYGRLRPGGLPIYDEEYFEWIDVLEAVSQAQERFVMMELGAGFGRWLVNAATAVRQTKTIPLYLVAVEAEPTHFAWLLQHLKDNGLNPNEHRLVEAAAGKSQGSVLFDCSFDPADEYGQGILSPKTQTWREHSH